METLFLWKSFPKPYKRLVVHSLKIQKNVWKWRPIRKSSIPILRFMREYQNHIRFKYPFVYTVEKFIKSETAGTLVHQVFGDDPFVYIQYSNSLSILAMRLVLQSMLRDMYIMRFVETVIHMQHSLIGLNLIEKFVHILLPVILTFIHINKK
jgi:hypothetical protein